MNFDTDAYNSGMSAEQRWSKWHQSMFNRSLLPPSEWEGASLSDLDDFRM